ncbi:MAG: hypothetical protein DSY42_06045 [Aquifex sp.]|nr:MAG: hypothetical protein DSY42_06045 [Aquifex sp.]
MKKYFLFIIAILLLFIGFGVFKIREKKGEYANMSTPKKYPYTVRAVFPERGELIEFRAFRGKYEPLKKGVLSAKVSGLVKEIRVGEGDKVKKGQVLAIVDPQDIKTQLEVIDAEIKALKEKLNSLETLVKTQKAIYERDKRLYKVGGISKEILDISYSRYKDALAKYEEVKSRLEVLLERKKDLNQTLSKYAYIRAPYDSVVRKIFVREGGFTSPGKPIIEIEGEGTYRILAYIPNEESVGSLAKVKLGNREFTLEVVRVFPSSYKNLKVVEIKSEKLPIPTESELIVEIATKKCSGYILPFESLLFLESGTYVVMEDKTLVKVKPEVFEGDKVCVKGNVPDGKRVLVAGQFRLREIALHNWPVRIK